MGIRSSTLWAIVAGLVSPAVCSAQMADSAPPLLLNGAPQNESVFLSWSKIPTASYNVSWRPRDSAAWHREKETLDNFFAVSELLNGKEYDFRVAANFGSGIIQSNQVRLAPHRRFDCNEPTHRIYCTQDSFLYAALTRMNAGSPFLCAGRVIAISVLMPNCLYAVDGQTLLLDRYSGSLFAPPSQLIQPELVRRVLLREVWRTENLDEVKAEARDRVSELPDTTGLLVSLAASVRTLLIRITPQLYSRVKWFSRPDHVPGRYAIYHEGHVASAAVEGAPFVNWLLANGWQVFAIDMPLEGSNRIDRRYPLFTHEDFALYDDGDLNPVQWFLLPVAAVMQIVREDAAPQKPVVLMMGRSGGGWTTMMYSAMDPDVSVAVNVAGSSPASTQLTEGSFPGATPEYEQQATKLYDQVSLTDILLTAGTKSALFFYSSNDPCCFRFSRQNAWVRYLDQLSISSSKKIYRVFVDDSAIHGLSQRGFMILGSYLAELGLGRKSASPDQ